MNHDRNSLSDELSDSQVDFIISQLDQTVDSITFEQKNLPPDLLPEYHITIDWARHAESCANFDSGNIQDKEKNKFRPLGYDVDTTKSTVQSRTPKQQTFIEAGKKVLTKITAPFKYQPNLSFIGMQHAVLLGKEYIKIKAPSYQAVFVSPLIRTIMTALVALRGTSCVIYVVPFISEVLNVANIIGSDAQNTPVPSEVLKRQIAFIKDWLQYNWVRRFDDIEVIDNLSKLKKN